LFSAFGESSAMVKVISYNIHCGIGNDGEYDLARIGATLKRTGCHIACLQEVEVNFEDRIQRKWSKKHRDNQAEKVCKAAFPELAYYSFAGPLNAYMGDIPERPKDKSCLNPFEEILVRDKEGKCGYGNAILSRFPILESRHLLFEQEYEALSEDYIYMDREQQPRGLRAILVDTKHDPAAELEEKGAEEEAKRRGPGFACCTSPQVKYARGGPTAPLWIINTHLSHKAGSLEQRKQVAQLMDFIEALANEPSQHGPMKPAFVLCGDLNAAPIIPRSSYSILSSDNRFVDAWTEKGAYWEQATFPSKCCSVSCGLHLDHVFMLKHPRAASIECKAIKVLNSVEDSEGSDHRPVVCELELEVSGNAAMF